MPNQAFHRWLDLQLAKSIQAFSIKLCSPPERRFVSHIDMERARAVYFTPEEQTILMKGCEEFKAILNAKSNKVAATKARENAWRKIAERVNACNPNGVKRSWKQIKTKYKNIMHSVNKRKSDRRKMGSQSNPCYAPAGELTLSYSQDWPVIDAAPGSISCSLAGSSTPTSFVKVEGQEMHLMELPSDTSNEISHSESHSTQVEALESKTISVCTQRPVTEIHPELTPDPISSPCRLSGGNAELGADSERLLYKRTLELDVEYKQLQIKKIKLEIEQLEFERMKRLQDTGHI